MLHLFSGTQKFLTALTSPSRVSIRRGQERVRGVETGGEEGFE